MARQSETPIEGNRESGNEPVTRTGDDTPASPVTSSDVKTFGGGAAVFLSIALVVIVVFVIIALVLTRR